MTLPDGIAELREFVREYMRDPTTIRFLQTYEDEQGLERTRWVTRENTVSFASPIGQRELMRAQQAGYEVDARRFLPAGTVVSEDDILVVDGVQWSVTGIPERTQDLAADVEVHLRRR